MMTESGSFVQKLNLSDLTMRFDTATPWTWKKPFLSWKSLHPIIFVWGWAILCSLTTLSIKEKKKEWTKEQTVVWNSKNLIIFFYLGQWSQSRPYSQTNLCLFISSYLKIRFTYFYAGKPAVLLPSRLFKPNVVRYRYPLKNKIDDKIC